MLAYLITFLSFIILYVLCIFINPISRATIQKVALLKYNESGFVKYKLVKSKNYILKEFIYTKNFDHIDTSKIKKVDSIYFFDRDYLLRVYEGDSIRKANDEAKESILSNINLKFTDIYNIYALSRFITFVRQDYEKDMFK